MCKFIISLGTRDFRPSPSAISAHIFPEGSTKPDFFFQDQYLFTAPRIITQEISSRINAGDLSYLDHLIYPIAKPGFEFILDREDRIEDVVFVVTDQVDDPDIEKKYQNNDTLYMADIMEHILARDFPGRISRFHKLRVTQNPTFFESMYHYFTKIFTSGEFDYGRKKVYIMLQSGVEASNLALILKCIERYPNLVQIAKPDGFEFAHEINIPQQFRQNYNKEKILEASRTFHYESVIQNSFNEATGLLGEYAYSCLAFDFDRARIAYDLLCKNDAQNLSFYQKLNKHLYKLTTEESAISKEMYIAAKMKFSQKAYADFLIRIFALSEQVLKPEIARILEMDQIKYDKSGAYLNWNEAISRKSSLKAFLEQSTIQGKPLRFGNPNIFVFVKILEWESNQTNQRSPFLDIFPGIQALRELRNNIAHSFSGVNAVKIENKLREYGDTEGNHTSKFFQDMDSYLGVKEYGIYDYINQQIIHSLT